MKNEEEEKLHEKFTIDGFIAVSLWAFLYWFYTSWIWEVFEISLNIKSAIIYYLIIWFLCFLLMCLIPKLRNGK